MFVRAKECEEEKELASMREATRPRGTSDAAAFRGATADDRRSGEPGKSPLPRPDFQENRKEKKAQRKMKTLSPQCRGAVKHGYAFPSVCRLT